MQGPQQAVVGVHLRAGFFVVGAVDRSSSSSPARTTSNASPSEPPADRRIIVPNGNGTSTLIVPGGYGIQKRGAQKDVREGVSSFLEKRPAHFTDKVSDGLPDVMPGWRSPEFE